MCSTNCSLTRNAATKPASGLVLSAASFFRKSKHLPITVSPLAFSPQVLIFGSDTQTVSGFLTTIAMDQIRGWLTWTADTGMALYSTPPLRRLYLHWTKSDSIWIPMFEHSSGVRVCNDVFWMSRIVRRDSSIFKNKCTRCITSTILGCRNQCSYITCLSENLI